MNEELVYKVTATALTEANRIEFADPLEKHRWINERMEDLYWENMFEEYNRDK